MAHGDYFTSAERLSIYKTIHQAELASRYEFSVYVGPFEGDDTRAFATQLHNRLVAPARSVMIAVDPEKRAVEIVTGGQVRQGLNDSAVELAVLEMQSTFAEGDLAGGVKRGVTLLAEHSN